MKVLMLVTHLQGIGHLARISLIGRALASRGAAVTLMSGGRPVPTIDPGPLTFVQLPPLASDGTNYRRLLDEQGRDASPELLASRVAAILRTLAETQPDVVVVELFPFGRRILAAEFLALFGAAEAAGTPVVVSLRDIVERPSKPARVTEAEAVLARYVRLVLVHGDARVLPLSQSWDVGPELASRMVTTGYVTDGTPAEPSDMREPLILVSSGGGVLGRPLAAAAIAAAPLLPHHRWRVFSGETITGPELPANLTIEPLQAGFRALLSRAAVSVSRAGYNTLLDVVQARLPAIIVPYDNGKEIEQVMRARAFAERGWVHLLPESKLSGHALADAILQGLSMARPDVLLDLGGADRSAALILASPHM